MKMKTCSTCGKTKTLSLFSKDRSKKDGLRTYCRACDNARQREVNAESVARNAASPFAHLTHNQRGNFAEDFARAYYHSEGYYCMTPQGDGCKADFVVQKERLQAVQVKLACWCNRALRVPDVVREARDAYIAAGIDVLFAVHPTEPYGWAIPMKNFTGVTIISPDGTDNYAQYKVILPVHFTPAFIEAKANQLENSNNV